MAQEYTPQKKQADKAELKNAIENYSLLTLRGNLVNLGIELGEDGKTPMSAGAPRLFLVKDGKAATLEESNAPVGSPAFLEAALKGQLFGYPAGEKRPVQLQGKADYFRFSVEPSEPLSTERIQNLDFMPPPEPARRPKPKWYHRLFNFIPSNQRKLDEYNRAEREHAKWEKEMEQFTKEVEQKAKNLPEQADAAIAIDERFGALRDEKSLAADQAVVEKLRRAHCQRLANGAKEDCGKSEYGIDVMTNVYSNRPKPRQEWLKHGEAGENESNGLYTEANFNKLTSATIDPAKVEIGGKGLTEREFATLAMFAATDADIGVAAQKQGVSDPSSVIQFYQQEGYTEKQAKQIIADSISIAYTMDVLHTDSRMNKYFDTAMNGGRALATKALKAYPGDKTQLAKILGQAVKTAGSFAGYSGDSGAPGMMKVAGDMLSLMERDPELKQLAKQSFEREEKEFCANTPFRERSFDDMVGSINKQIKFDELQQKAHQARYELLNARAEGKELSAEEKKGYVRDILTANLAEGMRLEQNKKIKKAAANKKGEPMNNEGLNQYLEEMGDKIEKQSDLATSAGGSTLPSSAPMLLQSAVDHRIAKKPAILDTVADPEKLAGIMRSADKIIEMNQLDRQSLDYLVDNVAKTGTDKNEYHPEAALKLAAKAEKLDIHSPARESKAPELAGPKRETRKMEDNKPQAAAPAVNG